MKHKVKKSLTIKQMAAVTTVTLVAMAIFITLQLYHLIQQRKDDYINQLYNTSVQVQKPLTEALLRSDLADAKQQLMALRANGILGRAIVLSTEKVQVINLDFATHRPIPALAQSLLGIPVQIDVPLYAYGVSQLNSPPLGYLVLQVDANRVYRFGLNVFALMLTSYLLLALVLVIAISWCINRIIVHPLRNISQVLNANDTVELLNCPDNHSDDEIGSLVKGYNHQINKNKHQQ